MLPCQKCGGDTAVVETRLVRAIKGVRRRRRCLRCNHRFTTHEIQPKDMQTYDLPHLAKTLIREHLLAQHTFSSVLTDAAFDAPPSDLLADYHKAETAFLEAAKATQQAGFYCDYYGTGFAIRCCEGFEEVQVDLLIKLEVA